MVGATRRMLNFFEQSLDGRSYFAGEAFTAADIMMHMPLKLALQFYTDEKFPNASAWRTRVESRPAYAHMVARALPNGPPPSIRGWPKEKAPAAG